ncbi:MAG TPA: ParB/RepB/Spo0J family partition protein [Vicinamibacterales bacterium]|nr:ParB/RepB/Spo0J family partition protein [Vicinamibacterales bacterium]
MHDFETPQSDSFDLSLPHPVDEETPSDAVDKTTPRPPQREGLPAHYRMRAERHYVDSITSSSAGIPIRLLPVEQFETPPPEAGGSLDALIKSIRTHGIVQPLLVRKRAAQYEVIAGKRRFVAATTLGLTEVPCVLHQVDDTAAAALSVAENVRANPGGASLRATVGAQISEAIGRIADDVSRFQASLAVLRSAPDGFERTVTADLLAAQASRTLWLANTAALLAGGRCRQGKRRPLSAILDDLVRQFDPECRLTGLRIDLGGPPPAVTVDDCFVTIALTTAVMMTLSLLDQTPQPVVEVHARLLDAGGIAAQVAQRQVPASQDIVDRFATRTRSAWTPMIFGLGAIALEHATAAHGGAADLVALDDVGSSIQLTFCRL